ncbi:MAG: DUF3526 domain-containing protein [Myxococcota bacterium]
MFKIPVSSVYRIALEEWRLWYRSQLAVAGLAVFVLLLVGTAWMTADRMGAESHRRLEQQHHAEERFLAQPDRHPHRMVHYGHYAFRAPTPLALFDPGVDAWTGEALFLEGHRQNSATFADAADSAGAGGFGRLTLARTYQLFVPLLLIALGHGVLLRERETRTLPTLLALGVSVGVLWIGKFLALLALAVALLVPAAIVVSYAVVAGGASAWVGGAVLGVYALYFVLWNVLILGTSFASRRRGEALALLMGVWLTWGLVVPRLAVAVSQIGSPTVGKLEWDFRMQEEARKAGDSHNPNDPAFVELRRSLLAKYGVDKVEELPINIRGVVAERGEAALTDVMNRFADLRMEREADQARALAHFGWLSPTVALGAASRVLAGTDLGTHHRFLREAESFRFAFVQGLNRIHAKELRYQDDVRRSGDPGAERRTRVSADHWALLGEFRFSRGGVEPRLFAAMMPVLMLSVWLLVLLAFFRWGIQRWTW